MDRKYTFHPEKTRVCVRCGQEKPRPEFRRLSWRKHVHASWLCDVCKTCQDADPLFMAEADSPWVRAEAEIMRRYGVDTETWMHDSRHPLNVLFLALVYSYAAPNTTLKPLVYRDNRSGRQRYRSREPGVLNDSDYVDHTVSPFILPEEAEAICEREGIHRIDVAVVACV